MCVCVCVCITYKIYSFEIVRRKINERLSLNEFNNVWIRMCMSYKLVNRWRYTNDVSGKQIILTNQFRGIVTSVRDCSTFFCMHASHV